MTKRVADLPEDILVQTYLAPLSGHLGDDCASLCPDSSEEFLVSADALLEGVHFLRSAPASWVAYKAVLANVSDIVADGGTCRWLTLCLSLPRDLELAWLASFCEGLGQALKETGVELVGGDTTASLSQIGMSLTAMGTAPRGQRVTRQGAEPGDIIAVTGNLGEALPGLRLELGQLALEKEADRHWRRRHFHPPFRGAFGRRLAELGLAKAMMDLSDGLAADLPRLCRASGLGAEVEINRLPLSRGARALGLAAEDACLGGEDFELLFAVAPGQWQSVQALSDAHDLRVSGLGVFVPGEEVRYKKSGEPVSLEKKSWRHFG